MSKLLDQLLHTPIKDLCHGHVTVLVIDDDRSVQFLFTCGLHRQGFEVWAVNDVLDAQEALQTIASQGKQVGTVIIDGVGIGMDPEEFRRQVHAGNIHGLSMDTPVEIQSAGVVDNEDHRRFAKPIDLPATTDRVRADRIAAILREAGEQVPPDLLERVKATPLDVPPPPASYADMVASGASRKAVVEPPTSAKAAGEGDAAPPSVDPENKRASPKERLKHHIRYAQMMSAPTIPQNYIDDDSQNVRDLRDRVLHWGEEARRLEKKWRKLYPDEPVPSYEKMLEEKTEKQAQAMLMSEAEGEDKPEPRSHLERVRKSRDKNLPAAPTV